MCVPMNNQKMGIAPKGLGVDTTGMYKTLPPESERTPGQVPGGARDTTGLYAEAPANVMSYGRRPDGTQKGTGYLGELKRPDGGVSTEITAGVTVKGKNMDIPLITPYATKEDLDYLLTAEVDKKKNPKFFEKMPKGLMTRAIKHANDRMDNGLPVYAD